MIVRRFVMPVVAAILVAGACGGDPPPPPPPPPGPDMDSLRAYQDSVRRAQEAAEAAERARREAAAAAERARAVAAARATLEQRVHFDYDQSAIRDDAAAALRAKVAILRASPQVRIRIEGHCDERGSTEYNLALGNRRAEAIRQFLTGFGISESRFEIVSLGENRPLAQGSTEQAWAQNRRGEFIITAGGDMINPAE